jgi:alkylhydroperoxidase family enzyme
MFNRDMTQTNTSEAAGIGTDVANGIAQPLEEPPRANAWSLLGRLLASPPDEQVLELRTGSASFDSKLDALVKRAGAIAANRGKVSDTLLQSFLDAGYTKEHLIDVIVNVGEKTITNFLHNVTDIPVDFPVAPVLETTETH